MESHDPRVARRVKELHGHRCQVCGTLVATPVGPYAESAHIRPLGRPHDGPDVGSNVLCLCPNHHVRFDYLAIHVTDDLRVVESATGQTLGHLRTVTTHFLDRTCLAYHRSLCGA